jgi:hypothetical protein
MVSTAEWNGKTAEEREARLADPNAWKGSNKNFVREAMTAASGWAADAMSCLPGSAALCFRQNVANGTATKNTLCLLYEAEEHIAARLRIEMLKDFPGYNIHVIPRRIEADHMKKMLNGRKLDYMYLDYCGPLHRGALETAVALNGCYGDLAVVSATFSRRFLRRQGIDANVAALTKSALATTMDELGDGDFGYRCNNAWQNHKWFKNRGKCQQNLLIVATIWKSMFPEGTTFESVYAYPGSSGKSKKGSPMLSIRLRLP